MMSSLCFSQCFSPVHPCVSSYYEVKATPALYRTYLVPLL